MKTLMALTVSLIGLSTASFSHAQADETEPRCYAPLRQIEAIRAVAASEQLAIETGTGDVSMIEITDMKDGAHPVISVKFVGNQTATVYDSHITCTGEVRELTRRP